MGSSFAGFLLLKSSDRPICGLTIDTWLLTIFWDSFFLELELAGFGVVEVDLCFLVDGFLVVVEVVVVVVVVDFDFLFDFGLFVVELVLGVVDVSTLGFLVALADFGLSASSIENSVVPSDFLLFLFDNEAEELERASDGDIVVVCFALSSANVIICGNNINKRVTIIYQNGYFKLY